MKQTTTTTTTERVYRYLVNTVYKTKHEYGRYLPCERLHVVLRFMCEDIIHCMISIFRNRQILTDVEAQQKGTVRNTFFRRIIEITRYFAIGFFRFSSSLRQLCIRNRLIRAAVSGFVFKVLPTFIVDL